MAKVADGSGMMIHLVTKVSVTELGRHSFTHVPRIGEWIEVKEKGEAVTYEVIEVSHSAGGTDLYVKRIGDREAAANSLRKIV